MLIHTRLTKRNLGAGMRMMSGLGANTLTTVQNCRHCTAAGDADSLTVHPLHRNGDVLCAKSDDP